MGETVTWPEHDTSDHVRRAAIYLEAPLRYFSRSSHGKKGVLITAVFLAHLTYRQSLTSESVSWLVLYSLTKLKKPGGGGLGRFAFHVYSGKVCAIANTSKTHASMLSTVKFRCTAISHKLYASHSGHGDFAAYHEHFKHREDVPLWPGKVTRALLLLQAWPARSKAPLGLHESTGSPGHMRWYSQARPMADRIGIFPWGVPTAAPTTDTKWRRRWRQRRRLECGQERGTKQR